MWGLTRGEIFKFEGGSACYIAIPILTLLQFQAVLTCPGCGYGNVNPEPDEEGDYVCAECGEILEVKVIY